MEKSDIEMYLAEVEKQCVMAGFAFQSIGEALNALNEEGLGPSSKKWALRWNVFRAVHSFLTHTSNVSKVFWGQDNDKNKVRRERANKLRGCLSLPDDEHILKKRTVRNALEHFDERLDEWRTKSKGKNYSQNNMGPIGAISGFNALDQMRHFDPIARVFYFRGDAFDLGAMNDGVQDILDRLKKSRVT